MGNNKLVLELKECVDIRKAEVVNDIVDCGDLKFLQLRDILMQFGTILKENKQDSIYVVKVKRGIFGKIIYLSVLLSDGKLKICGFAYKGKSNKDVPKLVLELSDKIRGKIK